MLTLRKAEASELDVLMSIYDTARSFMRKNGNMNQWINGYPDRETVSADICDGKLYAVCNGSEICGVFYFSVGIDETYNTIYDGCWLNNEEYGVVHRIGSSGTAKGVLKCAVDFAFGHVHNVRIDTHSDNTVMQHLLEKLGFTKCGIIYISDGTPRIAYHKKSGS